MSVPESIVIALFCMLVVFAILIMLWAFIKLFSLAIRVIEGRNKEKIQP